MRTNIDIDDDLIATAMRATGLRTKRAAVEEGLRALVRLHDQEIILDLAGKVHWSDDADETVERRNAA
jgi:Arc/MetJ family transcription regulator